ncbi:similar to Saccharomyces cerevisiae YDR319C YFT2 Putative protein of unknown function [Maudiozyma saulgeensis]|uniref:Acyl-coenzyme A diphosphatase YFT2 n=1 Tax=Maudiozyma saulgeensis TaxID=1789683 RepID=A0A1X7R2H2_9SACH|nr:similar to Saccharomyces cerevisiae YDR319C YFT2 Putative protein of unknown function [Kazachstania saulgeensis]
MEHTQSIRSRIPYSFHSVICLLYLVLFLVGTFLSFAVPESAKEHQKKTIYLLNSGNFINAIFAYKGNLVWTILFIYLAIVQIYIHTQNFELLPTSSERHTRNFSLTDGNVGKYTKQYIIKYIIKNLLLFICFVVIDEIFIFTGGQCSSGDQNIGLHSAEECRKTGGQWVGGFDISGHFCFLMNISLILWCELYIYYNYVNKKNIQNFMTGWITNGIIVILAVLMIWTMLLFITAVYYHTLMEKLLGCVLGYTCFYVMYQLIPDYPALSKYLY